MWFERVYFVVGPEDFFLHMDVGKIKSGTKVKEYTLCQLTA
jgi:hypothetical protein